MMETKQLGKLKYIISTPDDYVAGKKYPLIILLHGAGSRGYDINTLTTNPYFLATEPYHLQAITVAPQCYADSWFDIFEQLQEFVKFFYGQAFVDKDRVYLVGASMGGYATWQLAMTLPDLFAAIIPICGGGMYWNAARLKNIKVWAFHGTEDATVRHEESVKMVNAINAKGGNAKLTSCEGVAHDSWNVAYGDRSVFDWLLSQRKNHNSDCAENTYNDQEKFG